MTEAREISEERITEIRAYSADLLHSIDMLMCRLERPGVADTLADEQRLMEMVEEQKRLRDLLTALDAANKRAEEAEEKLRPGSPTERAPTVWAYEQACTALHQHEARATTAEAEAARLREALGIITMRCRDRGDPLDHKRPDDLVYGADEMVEIAERYMDKPPPPADRGEPSEEAKIAAGTIARLIDFMACQDGETVDDQSFRQGLVADLARALDALCGGRR